MLAAAFKYILHLFSMPGLNKRNIMYIIKLHKRYEVDLN